MQKITPFLWFDNQAEEAVQLYTSCFENSAVEDVVRYQENTPGEAGSVMTVTFRLAGQTFTALNGGPVFSFTPATSFFVECQTRQEVERLWSQLSEGGFVLMELGEYPFGELFGWLNDRFGVSWQIMLAGVPQRIIPALMFVGERNGSAEEAMRFYTSLFQNSAIDLIERYQPGEGEFEGTVKHARFHLNGQPFIAFDGGLEHAFTFTEAVSFFVLCEDQPEVDFFWERLSEGGQKSQCGWLTDRFGVTWQIVPRVLGELMGDPDRERASRVTQAMLKMTRLDIAELQRAYNQ